MTKRYTTVLLTLLLILPSLSHATVWTITTNGFTFTPNVLNITLGDTVLFSLGGNHNAVEVSQATWNANGNTSNGGFSLPFGGGTVIPTQVQTYFYVCQPHAGMGMKGQIVVSSSTGIETPSTADGTLKFRPNPASSFTSIHTGLPEGISARLMLYDITGKAVVSRENVMNNYLLDLSILNKGIYFVEIRSEGYIRTAKLVVEN